MAYSRNLGDQRLFFQSQVVWELLYVKILPPTNLPLIIPPNTFFRVLVDLDLTKYFSYKILVKRAGFALILNMRRCVSFVLFALV